MSPLKYVIASYGLFAADIRNLLIVGLVWLIFCLLMGKLWYDYRLAETENEIQNRFNPFQKQVRKRLKLSSIA
jgi:hypothetical protein